jgi:exportin-5
VGDAVLLALALLRVRPLSEPVAMFGLHILEHVVKARWVSLDAGVARAQFREVVLELLGSLSSPPSSAVLRRKAAALVVEVAKREWPQAWPELLPRLSAMCATAPDAALLVLRGLPDEVCVFQDPAMTPRRRADVLGALGAVA